MRPFGDNAKIARGIGIPPGSSLAMRCAVFAGFILGNYCYAQLWMAEGRARERADRERRARSEHP
jgi:hypothetical protein